MGSRHALARTLCACGWVGVAACGASGPSHAAPHADPPEAAAYAALLSRDAVGAEAFTRDHPTWDGRGVVIAVLDTGVDPSVPGLRETSDGRVKVIEARDFSGEGDVTLHEALQITGDGDYLRSDEGGVRGLSEIAHQADDDGIFLGFFDEASLANSAVKDLNVNGRRDDRFAVVAFVRADDGAHVAYVDTDGDGDISDEEPRQSYRDDPRPFTFTHPDPRRDRAPVAVALTTHLDVRERRVELHFDDGGHGTHVAGIAAGVGLEGRAGFDGIAPGAQILSLKIGHNALSGGATTAGSMGRALEHASSWARDHDVPVIINISYGIGSEREGTSDIDRLLDETLAGNRLLAASVSAGNDGPGISTVGTPAAATLAWTAGALLTPESARTLWGGDVRGDKVFAFSSRGGELAKPDGLTPGVAWSAVPPFMGRQVMAGTSMAAPQASGVHALLIGAARDEGVPWTAGAVKRALRATAAPLRGYSRIDQGAGVVRVPAAYEALKRQRAHRTRDVVAGWRATTPIPSRPGATGSASYWRVGAHLPAFPRRIAFDVAPIFFEEATDAERGEAFDTFTLDADVGWLTPDRGRIALRGAGPATFEVALDAERLRDDPGIHVGRVRARAGGIEAFDAPVVVIVPHRFDGVWDRSFEGRLAVGDVDRRFVEVPPGATTMVVTLDAPADSYGDTFLMPFDPEGRGVQVWSHRAESERAEAAELVLSGPELTPGVWELATYASFRNAATSRWEMAVVFRAVEIPTVATYVVPEGGPPEIEFAVTSRGPEAFRGELEAVVEGMEKRWTEEITGVEARAGFALGPDKAGADLWLEVSPEDLQRFTDIAANVVDADGRAVAQGAFGQRRTRLSFEGPPGDYRLELVGGATHEDDALTWSVDVTLVQRLREPITLDADHPGDDVLTLFPHVSTPITLTAADAFVETPDGYAYRADVTLTSREGDVWYHAPVTLSR